MAPNNRTTASTGYSAAPRWAWPLTACTVLLALLALASRIDSGDDTVTLELQQDAAVLRAYQAGREQGHAEMLATATAAWAAAHDEAELCRVRRLP